MTLFDVSEFEWAKPEPEPEAPEEMDALAASNDDNLY